MFFVLRGYHCSICSAALAAGSARLEMCWRGARAGGAQRPGRGFESFSLRRRGKRGVRGHRL